MKADKNNEEIMLELIETRRWGQILYKKCTFGKVEVLWLKILLKMLSVENINSLQSANLGAEY
jgi:hypothetical protein